MTTEPSTEIVPTQTKPQRRDDSFLQPAAPAYEIVDAFKAYMDLCDRLLSEADYQRIGNKDFRKKSAWRKLAAAYNISDEIVSKEYERNDRGRIVMAEVVVRATAPNGRTGEGLGICDLFEKCCDPSLCKNNSKYHTHCTPDCDGARHFSNPQHDLPATAHTRAKNRALADLVGAGEVSAEEMNTNRPHDPEPEPEPKSFRDRLKDLPEALQDAFPKWLEANGYPKVAKQWNAEQARAATKWLENAEQGELDDGSQDGTTSPDSTESATQTAEGDEPTPEPATGVTEADERTEMAQLGDDAGDDAVKDAVDRVKAMKPAEVRAELDARGIDYTGQNVDQQRKALTLAILREHVAAASV